MVFQKGHKQSVGNKGGGRKTLEEEIAVVKEAVKRQTIEELATSKVFNHLGTIDDKTDRQGIKEIAMPVYLKSKADKKEVDVNIKTITGMKIIKE